MKTGKSLGGLSVVRSTGECFPKRATPARHFVSNPEIGLICPPKVPENDKTSHPHLPDFSCWRGINRQKKQLAPLRRERPLSRDTKISNEARGIPAQKEEKPKALSLATASSTPQPLLLPIPFAAVPTTPTSPQTVRFFPLSEDSTQCRWFRFSLRCFLPHSQRRGLSARGNPRNSEVSVVSAFSRVFFRAESGDWRWISLRFYELCGVVELWGRWE